MTKDEVADLLSSESMDEFLEAVESQLDGYDSDWTAILEREEFGSNHNEQNDQQKGPLDINMLRDIEDRGNNVKVNVDKSLSMENDYLKLQEENIFLKKEIESFKTSANIGHTERSTKPCPKEPLIQSLSGDTILDVRRNPWSRFAHRFSVANIEDFIQERRFKGEKWTRLFGDGTLLSIHADGNLVEENKRFKTVIYSNGNTKTVRRNLLLDYN